VLPDELEYPEVPPVPDAVHEKLVPPTFEVKAMFVVEPEQMLAVLLVTVATGMGFTTTSTVKAEPGHELAVGVTVYLTVAAALLVFVSVCVIVVPQEDTQLLNPVVPEPETSAAFHVNVVPVTVEFKATLVVAPLQMVCPVAEPEGVGFTVTITEIGVPGQLLAVGVTV
jgi:hypothetical protein